MKKRIHFVLLAFLVCNWGMPADSVSSPEPIQGQVTAEIEVSLIGLYASVRDSKDRPVKGLNKDDFLLTNAGKPLEIAQFSGDPDEAASVAFLMDTSGSMRIGDKYDIAERLVDAILERLQGDDEAALITFADEKVQTLVELTKDKTKVSNQLAGQRLYGPTALWDAIIFSQKMVIQNYGKKAIILVSDGFDNRSENAFKRAVEEASKVQLPVYVCEIRIPEEDVNREEHFDSPLKDFAEATGALHFVISADEEKQIKRVAERVVEELRYQYYLGVPGGAVGSTPQLQLATKKSDYKVRLRHSIE